MVQVAAKKQVLYYSTAFASDGVYHLCGEKRQSDFCHNKLSYDIYKLLCLCLYYFKKG